MSSILQDLRYAARRLVRDRRFTLAAVAALALGIGATSAVFTLVNAVILRSLPFDEPDRIMWLGTRDAKGGEFGVSEPDFEDWRRATRTFSGMALMQMGAVNFSADERAPDRYDAVYISWNGFSLIGAQPAIGRGFSAEDDRPGAPAVVLLSHTVWQSRYGGDRSVVGRAISRECGTGHDCRRHAAGDAVSVHDRSLAADLAEADRANARRPRRDDC